MRNSRIETLGNNNWSAPLTNALSGISNKYSAKQANEEQLKREAILRKEQLRRENLLRAEDTRRYNERKAIEAANTAENTRRFELGQKQAADALQREKDGITSQFDLMNYADNVEFGLKDQEEDVQRRIIQQQLDETEEVKGLFQLLNGVNKNSSEENDKKLLENAFNSSKGNLIKNGNDPLEAKFLLERRYNNLQALAKEFKEKDYSKEEKEKRIQDVLKNQYAERRAILNRNLDMGVGLSKERRVRNVLSNMPEDLKSKLLNPTSARTAIENAVGGTSEAEIIARENNRAALLSDQSKAEVKATELEARLGALYKTTGSSASVINKRNQSPEEVKASLKIKMLGGIDKVTEENKEISGYVDYLADQGFSEYEIERAIAANISPGSYIDLSLGDINVGSLKEVQASAEQIRNSEKPLSSSGGRVPSKEELTAKVEQPRTLAQIAMDDLGLGRYKITSLDARPEYRQQVLEAQKAQLDALIGDKPAQPAQPPVSQEDYNNRLEALLSSLQNSNQANSVLTPEEIQSVDKVTEEEASASLQRYNELLEKAKMIGPVQGVFENKIISNNPENTRERSVKKLERETELIPLQINRLERSIARANRTASNENALPWVRTNAASTGEQMNIELKEKKQRLEELKKLLERNQ
jgi:hypothetical protein